MIPGKVSGVPLVVGNRIQAHIICEYLDSVGGLAELAEDYPSLTRKQIQELASFAEPRKLSRRLVKVLLDENLPHQLRLSLQRHEVRTAQYIGWGGMKNGELLRAAEAAGIKILVTSDQNLTYQQNLSRRSRSSS